MRTIVEPLPHDLAVIDALETIGRPVGFAAAPAGTLNSDGLPTQDYMTVWRVGSERNGPLGDAYDAGTFTYQITSVGRLPDGVSWLTGQIEEALVGTTITGRVVTQVEPLLEQGPFPDRDIGPPHPFYAISQYRLHTVPA